MIRKTMKVLAMIGVLLHLVSAAEQAKEANQSSNRKLSLSEQFVSSLSVMKGSDKRALHLKKEIETTTLRLSEETYRTAGLSRRMQKQRTMQRRKPRFRQRPKRSKNPGAMKRGGRGVGNDKWGSSAGWSGSSSRVRKGQWPSSGRNRNSSGGNWHGRTSNKPIQPWKAPRNSSWGSPWKPGYSPTKRE